MPIYVYQCTDCSQTFEELVLSKERVSAISCPECHSTALLRKQAAFATTSGSKDAEPTCGGGACSACSFDD